MVETSASEHTSNEKVSEYQERLEFDYDNNLFPIFVSSYERRDD